MGARRSASAYAVGPGHLAWLGVAILGLVACKAPGSSPDYALRPDVEADADASQGEPDVAPADAATDAGVESDLSAKLFHPDEVLDVELELEPRDWETIRKEARSFSGAYSGCFLGEAFEYTMVPARVSIDGHEFEKVGVRKKGLLGSLSTLKPSLRIDLQEYVEGQALFGEKVLTLNNSIQDKSFVRQCMAFAAFEAAGVPAPRCNFARVRVNGESMGTYVHVEAIKKPFLARRFGDDDGDLYEGVLGDFRSDRLAYFEKKTNEDEPLSPELTALSQALERPDAELLAALSPLIDLDEFMRLWATEALLGHEDSYSGNQNNFFVYVHPDTRKLSFIPWGTDGAFLRDNPFGKYQGGRPQSVYAVGKLARRLYALPETRDQYRATLRMLLSEHWNAAALLAEVDRIAALVGEEATAVGLEQVREFVRTRRSVLEPELDAAAPAWSFAEAPEIVCRPELSRPAHGSFETSWGTSDEPGVGLFVNAVEVELESGPLEPLFMLSNAGPGPDGSLVVGFVMWPPDGSMAVIQVISRRPRFELGELAFHGFETFGVLLTGADKDHLKIQGYIGDGSVTFEQVGMQAGDPVIGHFDGLFTYFGI